MTEIIGDHGLFCIEDTDYAAFALAMQCNAQAADLSLSSFNSSLSGYLNRPWIQVVTTNAAVVDSDASSGTTGPGGLLGEAIDTTGSGAGSPSATRNGVTPGLFLPAGIWLVGSSIKWTFGATTASSYRQLQTFNEPRIGGIASYVNGNQIFAMRDYQGDAGATGALTSVGIVDNRSGNSAAFVSFISHANLASDMTVAAGDWRLWATYLGSGVTF